MGDSKLQTFPKTLSFGFYHNFFSKSQIKYIFERLEKNTVSTFEVFNAFI